MFKDKKFYNLEINIIQYDSPQRSNYGRKVGRWARN